MFGNLAKFTGIGRLLVLIFIITVNGNAEYDGEKVKDTKKSKQIDSLISLGKKCLQENDLNCAQEAFKHAFKIGMSKDSMYYFAAEIYMKKSALDTSIVFNKGLEINGKFDREVINEQRARIYRQAGLIRQADSIVEQCKKGIQSRLAVYTYGTRNNVALQKFLLAPVNYTIVPDNDIDDMGRLGLTYKLEGRPDGKYKKLFALFDFNTALPLPTRYSFDEKSDTLLRALTAYLAIPWFPQWIRAISGYRLAIHDDGKLDHFNRAQIFLFLRNGWYFNTMHESKWIKGPKMDETTEYLTTAYLAKKRRFVVQLEIGLSHHFDQEYLSKKIIVGYIDTIDLKSKNEQKYKYFRDKTLQIPFDSPFLDEYWNNQPGFRMISIPEHSFSLLLKTNLQIPVKKLFFCRFKGEIRGTLFPSTVKWYTYGLMHEQFENFSYDYFSDDFLVYHAGDGKYYLHDDPTSHNYNSNNLTEIQLNYQHKKRIECFFLFDLLVEREFKHFGALYCSMMLIKNFSTMNEYCPIPSFDYIWELRAGWRKEILFRNGKR